MITQLENELARHQRRKHAHRVAFATSRIAALVGIKVTCANHAKRHRTDHCGVYEIEGVKRKFIGIPQVREWLFDKGVAVSVHTINKMFHDGVANIRGHIIRKVGSISRNAAGLSKEFVGGKL